MIVDLKYSAHTHTHTHTTHMHTHNYVRLMPMLSSLILVIISQCVSRFHVVQLKYIQFSLVSFILVKLEKGENLA